MLTHQMAGAFVSQSLFIWHQIDLHVAWLLFLNIFGLTKNFLRN